MKNIKAILFISLVVLISACAPRGSGLTAPLDATQQTHSGLEEQTRLSEIPTPASDDAVITGYLLQGISDPEPLMNAILYLAEIVDSTDGRKALASFDRRSSPATQTDMNGKFIFTQVEPNEYALVLDRIYNSFLLQDPEAGGDFLFVAKAGEILNLGDLVYLSLPGAVPE